MRHLFQQAWQLCFVGFFGLLAAGDVYPQSNSIISQTRCESMSTNDVRHDGFLKDLDNILREGQTLLENAHWQAANMKFIQGIEKLGDAYSSPDIIDDTGMKLTLADIEAQAGNIGNSAKIRGKVLSDRLLILRKKSAARNNQ